MALSNYERLVKLAEEVFAVKSDPNQLDVNQEIIDRLLQIHPATVSEYRDENGPVAWLLLIPTTFEVMDQFLAREINEQELFEMTLEEESFDALYLCSALVLEEYRRKGITRKLALDAIQRISNDHPIKVLFTWVFTEEGELTAEAIAMYSGLPLLKR